MQVYRASKCHKTILLKIWRSVASLNSSTEIILKCLKNRDATLCPVNRGDSMEHIIYKLENVLQSNGCINPHTIFVLHREIQRIHFKLKTNLQFYDFHWNILLQLVPH